MSKQNEDDFFIGWAETPRNDRRFFLKSGIGLLAGTAAIAGGVAALQNPPGPGQWNQNDIREWSGTITNQPYAMLRTRDVDGSPKTVLLSCLGKCGVSAQIGALSGQPVTITGSLIQRGSHAMIAVNETGEWIRRNDSAADASLAFPELTTVGEAGLAGEILDTKCWFGAMRPSEGKVHKACAALCIRGGLPPAFFVRSQAGRGQLLIMINAGQAHGEALLPYVADPVAINGTIMRQGGLLFLDAPVSAIRRT